MKLTFIGAGYVGLVSAAALASLGHQVSCLDTNQHKIHDLQQHLLPIYEPGLKEIIGHLPKDNLIFSTNYAEVLPEAEAVFITVGTPTKLDGSADLTYLWDALEELLPRVQPNCLIIVKSTVPPGTCQAVQQYIIKQGYPNLVASNPEFLREGSAVKDFLAPDRIVVGADQADVAPIMRQVYAPLLSQKIPLIETSLVTAEMIKYAANVFLANRVALINEIADLCEIAGADVTQLAPAVGMDHRIGPHFLQVSPGYGGSCFPKDVAALANYAHSQSANSLILDAIMQANEQRIDNIITKLKKLLKNPIEHSIIAFWGATYKANTDDLRCSPSVKLMQKLIELGATVQVYDPQGLVNLRKELPEAKICATMALACISADIIMVATEWQEFAEFDFKQKLEVKHPIIFDLRHIVNAKSAIEAGFTYHALGRPSSVRKH